MIVDSDWKSLWKAAGQNKISNLKIDNNIDSTDTTVIEDNEVNIISSFFLLLVVTVNNDRNLAKKNAI